MYESHDIGDATKFGRFAGAPKHGWLPCTKPINMAANISASEIITKYLINLQTHKRRLVALTFEHDDRI